jgi:hypothetical protein
MATTGHGKGAMLVEARRFWDNPSFTKQIGLAQSTAS